MITTITDTFTSGMVDGVSVHGRTPETAPLGYVWIDDSGDDSSFDMSVDGGIHARRNYFAAPVWAYLAVDLPDCARVTATVQWYIGGDIAGAGPILCGMSSGADNFPNTRLDSPEYGSYDGDSGSVTTTITIEGDFSGGAQFRLLGRAGDHMSNSVAIVSVSLEIDTEGGTPAPSLFWTNFVLSREEP